MAGFLNSSLPSDDEEDDDYNPAADNTAEREDLPQTAAQGRGAARKKRRRGAAVPITGGEDGGGEDDGDGDDNNDDDDDDDAEAQVELDARVLAKQAKVASLWQQINARAAANGSGTQRLPSASVNLAALCRSTLGAKKPKRAEQDAVGSRKQGLRGPPPAAAYRDAQIWMRSLGLLRPSKPVNTASLWPGQQQQQPAAAAAAPAVAAEAGGGSASTSPPSSRGGTPGPGTFSEDKRAVAAAALAAARDATTAGSRLGKVAVTEVRRFAGKDIQVTMHVDKDSKEAQKAAARAAAPPPPPASSGLDAVLAEIEKKKKVSVLDKTKADWSEYKAANTEVDEELETYKRSGEQYLDKQNFLKRAELREYEKERDLRLASDVRTRGRL